MTSNQLNTTLVEEIFKFSRFMKGQMSCDSALMNLSMLQLQVLVFLKRNEPVQMSEIAKYFAIELPSATSLINKVTKMGLVERKADKHDRRLVLISLTKDGNALLQKAMEEKGKKITETLSYLSEKDKKELLRIMQLVTATMEKEYEK